MLRGRTEKFGGVSDVCGTVLGLGWGKSVGERDGPGRLAPLGWQKSWIMEEGEAKPPEGW